MVSIDETSLFWQRPPHGPDITRKLRRGFWPVQDHLDLHGLRSDEAHALVDDFLLECTQRGLRCVRIIHGKGRRSPGGLSVLKMKMSHWLQSHEQVMAFCEAMPKDGGAGAVLVLFYKTT